MWCSWLACTVVVCTPRGLSGSICTTFHPFLVQVGYDTSGEHPHYIVKNSWGDSWGEQVGPRGVVRQWRRCAALARCVLFDPAAATHARCLQCP